jgi:hypothetical protein
MNDSSLMRLLSGASRYRHVPLWPADSDVGLASPDGPWRWAVAWMGGSCRRCAEKGGLSTNMQNLLGWYKTYIEKKDFKRYITADVREEHYFKRYLIHIQLDELFQLFNQRDLDKSIIACYCM